jgi:glucose-6-phosphate 1-epimerase
MSNPQQHEIAGHLTVAEGHGGLTKLLVQTPWSTAELYLHGAHLTDFRKIGEPPLLFTSAASGYQRGKAIRGGVPVIFPWFGGREGFPAHGYARTSEWQLTHASRSDQGAITLRLTLPELNDLAADYEIVVADGLTMSLRLTNRAATAVELENCLHTYFQVSDVEAISLTGLTGATFLDALSDSTLVETAPAITIASEVDRVYQRTPATVEILDPGFQRRIRVAKSGSESTVVWNPWIDKSKRMADFGDEEYRQMVCVESGNIAPDAITLAAAAEHVLRVELSSHPLV